MKLKQVRLTGIKTAEEDSSLGDGEFTGYASTFIREPDSYGDVVAKGAFVQSLEEWKASGNVIPLLYGHRMDDPMYNIGGVLDAKEDDRGLKVHCAFDLDNPVAAQSYRLTKARRLGQMSFAYDVLDEAPVELENGVKANELRALKLYEVSLVPIGANQDTEILAVKASAQVLVDGLKAGRVLSAKNESELRTAYAAIGNVLAALGDPQEEDNAEGEQASGTESGKDEEPTGAKSEDRDAVLSVGDLDARIALLARLG